MIGDLGALWIDRSEAKKGGMTAYMASLFQKHEGPLTVVVTPEGTRSMRKEWKMGFYHTAVQAKVPICCAYMDYEKKITGVGMCFMPTGEIEADVKQIMDFYKDIKGKFPENFSLDQRYC